MSLNTNKGLDSARSPGGRILRYATSIPIHHRGRGRVYISGLITCIGVAVETPDEGTGGVSEVVVGHFITPIMFGSHGLTNKGKQFLEQIKSLMSQNGMTKAQSELICYYAPRLDNKIHQSTRLAMKPIAKYMEMEGRLCATSSTFYIDIVV